MLLTGDNIHSGTAHVSRPHSFISHHISDLDSWLSKGILTLENLYDGASLYSFSDLQTKYGLPHAEYFKYLIIRHFIKKNGLKAKNYPILSSTIIN